MINTVPIAGQRIPVKIVTINGRSNQLLFKRDINQMIGYDQNQDKIDLLK